KVSRATQVCPGCRHSVCLSPEGDFDDLFPGRDVELTEFGKHDTLFRYPLTRLPDRANAQFRANAPYDVLVRELLTAPISDNPQAPAPVLRDPTRPNPLAFYAVKDAKPENLAAATARVFLGIQIECAQCHDHPFARWERDQFWNLAAFFAG